MGESYGYKLKPCPFCGGEAIFSKAAFHNANFDEMGWKVTVMCSKCGIYTPEQAKVRVSLNRDGSVSYDHEALESLARSWNRRLSDD